MPCKQVSMFLVVKIVSMQAYEQSSRVFGREKYWLQHITSQRETKSDFCYSYNF